MGRRKEVHQFPLRLPIPIHGEAQTLSLQHDISMNLLLVEMIRYAYKHPTFKDFLQKQYPHNEQKGHYVYIHPEYK